MRIFIALFVLGFTALAVEGAFHDRKIFVSQFSGKAKTLTELSAVRKQIKDQTLANLKALSADEKAEFIKMAEAMVKHPYPVKTAWDYMEFARDGNRNHYEGKINDHNNHLSVLIIGHLLDREKNATSNKYISNIIDGVWMILEESTWCWPAHLSGNQGVNEHLPAPGHLAIDLGAGEIAKWLGWIKLLVGDQFDHVSKVINQRIDYELKNRIFEGYLQHNYGWAGFGGSHVVNNWDIWVNGNILKSAVFTLDDMKLFDQVLNKTLYSSDYFLDGYGDDGGCDEGPAYWRQAGGRLIEYLQSLEELFPGAKAYFKSNKLIQSIGQYSYKMLITKNWFVNFADSIPTITYPPTLLAMYGDLFDDEGMKHFSNYIMQFHNRSTFIYGLTKDLNEFCNYLNLYKEINSFKVDVPISDLVWLPDVQVINSRSKSTETGAKFFIAAKAGTNHESHNHNDVGNFVLFQNGNPVIIDVGVGTYTAQTFNSHRYELFYMQSQYHNCPTINGIQQGHGDQFNSQNTSMKEFPNQEGFHFSSDIAGTYPKEAQVKSWIRSVQFNRTSNTVQIEDQYQLEQFVAAQKLHFMTVHDMKVEKTNQGLSLKNSNANVEMDFDWQLFTMEEETKSLDDDHHLTGVWGESVKRITLTTNPTHKELTGHFTVRFSQGK